MTQDRAGSTTTTETGFFYTEECGLALMQARKSHRKLALEKSLWAELVESIQSHSHPGATQFDSNR